MPLFVKSDCPQRFSDLKVDLTTSVGEIKRQAHSALKLEKDISDYTYTLASYLKDAITLNQDNEILKDLGANDGSTIILSLGTSHRKLSQAKPKKDVSASESKGGGTELPSDITEENVLGKLEKSKGDSREKLLSWIDGKAKGVFESKAFLKTSKSTLVELLKRDTLGVAEIDAWEAAIRWAAANGATKEGKTDLEAQKKILSPIIPLIRFPLIGSQQLASKVVPLNILPSDVVLALFSYVAQREAKLDPALPKELDSFSTTPRTPPGPKPGEFKNRAGVPVLLGTRGIGRGRFYCSRSLGTHVIPDSDGTCGPNDGPQCPDCLAFVPVNGAGAPTKVPSSGLKFYCGRNLGVTAMPRSNGICGPNTGPQCTDCRTFQKRVPRYKLVKNIRRK